MANSSTMRTAPFTQGQVEAVADALGDAAVGLTGSEIGELLRVCKMPDPAPSASKRHRLLAAFAASRNAREGRGAILAFVRRSMTPGRWPRLRDAGRFEPLRANLNGALASSGLACNAAGVLEAIERPRDAPEAERRARDLRAGTVLRGGHPDVVRCCRPEWITRDRSRVLLEAAKGVADKLRARTGLPDDGTALVDRSLGGRWPVLAINPRGTEAERDEQKAFIDLVKGFFGMFPGPAARGLGAKRPIGREDAEDLLSLASLIHRRLDSAQRPARVARRRTLVWRLPRGGVSGGPLPGP